MFEGEEWYEYLDEPMKELLDLGFYLLDREKMAGDILADYAFVVFPVAKAYEGFIKKFVFDLGLITKEEMMGRDFRVGRSLNPALPGEYKNDQWIYERLEKILINAGMQGRDLPREMWEAWKMGRNQLFHYFIGQVEMLSLSEAKERVEKITEVMKRVISLSLHKQHK